MGAYDFLMNGAQGVQLQDPVAQAQRYMSLAEIVNRNKLQDYALQTAHRKDEAATGMGQALGGLDINDDAAVMRAVQSAPPDARQMIVEHVMKMRKEGAEAGYKKAETDAKGWEVKKGQAAVIGNLANYLANKPDVNQQDVMAAAANVKALGLDPSQIIPPPGMDPRAHWQALAGQAMDAVKQIELKGQAEQRLETNRHNTTEETLGQGRLTEEQRNHNMVNARARDANAQANKGTLSIEGYDAQGQPVMFNNKSGEMSSLGQGGRTPYSGPITTKAAFEKQADAAGDLLGAGERADKLLTMVQKNPRAFGDVPAVASMLPNFASSRINERALSPEDRQVRITVMREAAVELNRLYGAALSAGENRRAQTFIPDPSDGPAMIMTKLQAARDWARESAGASNPGAAKAAQARIGAKGGDWQDMGGGFRVRAVGGQ